MTVQICELTKRYDRHLALDRLSLNIGKGEIVGLLGPNGAGKTTTIRAIVGLIRPTSGKVLVGGYDVARQPTETSRRIGFVPDKAPLPPMLTGWEYLRMRAAVFGLHPQRAIRRAHELLDQLDMLSAAGQLAETYSHGQRQKLSIAAALLHTPELLILDEPIVGLDPRGIQRVQMLISQAPAQGITVLLSTHLLHIAEDLCSRVVVLQHGRLLADASPAALRGTAGSLENGFLMLTAQEAT